MIKAVDQIICNNAFTALLQMNSINPIIIFGRCTIIDERKTISKPFRRHSSYRALFRRNQFNLLVYGRDRPYFSKRKKIILQNFGLLAFLNFYSMFLFYCFMLLDKTYNNQNQEGFIICQKQLLEVFRKKRCS